MPPCGEVVNYPHSPEISYRSLGQSSLSPEDRMIKGIHSLHAGYKQLAKTSFLHYFVTHKEGLVTKVPFLCKVVKRFINLFMWC